MENPKLLTSYAIKKSLLGLRVLPEGTIYYINKYNPSSGNSHSAPVPPENSEPYYDSKTNLKEIYANF